MDSCEKCSKKGDLKGCMTVVCQNHQSWFVKQLITMLQEARDTIDTLPGYPKGADLCDRIEIVIN